jgi:hypothetical protein
VPGDLRGDDCFRDPVGRRAVVVLNRSHSRGVKLRSLKDGGSWQQPLLHELRGSPASSYGVHGVRSVHYVSWFQARAPFGLDRAPVPDSRPPLPSHARFGRQTPARCPNRRTRPETADDRGGVEGADRPQTQEIRPSICRVSRLHTPEVGGSKPPVPIRMESRLLGDRPPPDSPRCAGESRAGLARAFEDFDGGDESVA